MVGRTHIAVGLATSAVAAVAAKSNPLSLTILIPAIIGSLTPDIDIDGSTITKRTNELIKDLILLAVLYFPMQKIINLNLTLLSNKVTLSNKFNIFIGILIFIGAAIWSRITGHRNFSHSILGAITFILVMMFIFKPGVKWFAIGYISHLFIDLLNYKGESIFYPFDTKFQIGLCKAGGLIDNLICLLSFISFCFILMIK